MAAADERLARGGFLALPLHALLVEQARGEHRHRLRAIAVLRTVVLALDHDPGWQVSDANCGIGLVHMLAASARSAEGVDPDLRGVDGDVGDRIGFGQHRNRAGRGMDSSLRLGFRDALHAMPAGFELELRVDAVAHDAADHFLEPTHVAGALRNHLDLPAIAFGETRVHAEEIPREERRLVASRHGADFQEYVALVIRIAR